MKKNEIAKLVLVGGIAGLFSLVLSNTIFSAGQKPVKVPVVQALSTDFPDVHNDPAYQAIFNTSALDPTQLIQIGNNQNTTPFNGQ